MKIFKSKTDVKNIKLKHALHFPEKNCQDQIQKLAEHCNKKGKKR